jgi:hypothetical protein
VIEGQVLNDQNNFRRYVSSNKRNEGWLFLIRRISAASSASPIVHLRAGREERLRSFLRIAGVALWDFLAL